MTFFDDLKFLTYKDQRFLVDKFSGFNTVEVTHKILSGITKIEYTFDIYFSGHTLTLSSKQYIDNYKSNGFIFKDDTPEFKFIYSLKYKNAYEEFKKDGYVSKNHSDIISDYVKWFAEKTNTSETLRSLKRDIEFCFNYIDEHYKR